MSTSEPALLMTMSDIAALARVQRPVVSVWRTRAARSDTPFPSPVSRRRGQDLFDAHQVGQWLTDTHRGNNPEASMDTAAHAIPGDSTGTAGSTLRAVTALLALRSQLGIPLGALSDADLLDAADEHDPDDALFYREIDDIGAARGTLVGYVDALVEAAYGEAPAFERILADRFRLGAQGHGDSTRSGSVRSDTALSAPALELLALAASALAATEGSDAGNAGPVFVDATGSAGDILLAVAHARADAGRDLTVLTPNDDGDPARLLRRRLLVHGITRVGLEVQHSGAFAVTGTAVHIAQLPSASQSGMTPAEMLSAIDQIVLQMTNDQLGVVIAPSAVLNDAGLSRESDELRSTLLRSGRVRAIVRLPAGLLTTKPQQAQALWVLGAAHAHVPLADRWTMVADLTATPLTEAVIDDLISDLIATLGDRGTVRAHAFRFARFVLTRTLLASHGSLVAGARTVAATPQTHGAALAVRVDELLALLTPETDAAPGLSGLARLSTSAPGPSGHSGSAAHTAAGSAAHTAAGSAAPQTIEQLLAAKHLRYIPGNRLDVDDIAVGGRRTGGIRLIGPAEVLGDTALGHRSIDRLRFAADYPSGRVTEPGDVVFTTVPRPAAIVDREGTSVVLFPARILRINPDDPNGLLSEIVASDITALPHEHRGWQRWPLRQVHHRQRAALADALASVRLEQERAHERLAHLDELTSLLMAGVTAGSLTVSQTVGSHISHAFASSEGTN
ncbi:hypothetical protein [Cryobacterium psychrophilum]|uniref:DNA methylase adenine-specific domain-containing protein n=1 Tax=Cryobacterium psychrophilum TaxID=41988 RepID=A0A4Y8KLZ5_9MICO|nr:hypothetical protein [Cryobacterium psychrophilum]TDW28940.1 hypothetical protein EDD25_0610 [Cryobacterium psychrophilum]TFD76888.1 hypothetical protein E3T53_12765 [Cryobacterium psychrophilum]